MLAQVGKTFHLGVAAQARLFPASFGGLVAGVLICGYVSDWIGKKIVLLVSMGLFITGAILFSMAQSFNGILLSSAIIGAGSGSMQSVSNALLSNMFPVRSSQVLMVMQVMYGLGCIGGPITMTALIAHGVGWRQLYVGLAVCGGLLFLLQALQKVPEPAKNGAKRKLLLPWESLPMTLLCLGGFFCSGAEVGFWGMIGNYIHSATSLTVTGLAIALFWVGMTAGRLVTSFLVQKISLSKLLTALSLATALFMFIASRLSSEITILAAVLLAGFALSGTFGILLSLGVKFFAQEAGAAIGMVTALACAGSGVTPWLEGVLKISSGWHIALLVPPVCALLLAVSGVMLQRQKQPVVQ